MTTKAVSADVLLERQFRRDIEQRRDCVLHKVPAWAFWMYKLDWRLNTECVKTAHTNGVWVEVNPRYWSSLTPGKKEFLMAHACGHPALKDLWRRGNRDPLEWNEACDFRLNLLLIKAGFTEYPEGILLDPQFEGMSAEMVFSLRKAQQEPPKQPPPQPEPSDDDEEQEDQEQQAGSGGSDNEDGPESGQEQGSPDQQDSGDSDQTDEDGPESGQGDGSDEGDEDSDSDASTDGSGEGEESQGDESGAGDGESSEGEGDSEGNSKYPMQDSPTGDFEDGPEPGEEGDEDDWDLAVRMAERQATKAGKMPGGLAEALRESREPRVDWISLTRQFVDNNIATRTSFATPNRRYLGGLNMLLPGAHKEHVGAIVLIVDTSGSTLWLREQFGGELIGLVRDVQPEKLIVIYIDTEVQKVVEYTPEASEIKLEMYGGGGTLAQPAFDWIEEHNIDPLCAFYLTDLELGDCPEEPRYPVMWVVPEHCQITQPFGELVRIP